MNKILYYIVAVIIIVTILTALWLVACLVIRYLMTSMLVF